MFNFLKPKLKIATHDGNFHSDEIFGVATLLLFLGEKYDIKIIRTREKDKINTADFVLDVGGEYNIDKKRFDHHQIGGAGVRDNGIPYASFGLVWKEYGEKLSGNKKVADGVEQKLVLPIDARDNGVEISKPLRPDFLPYEIRDIVSSFRTTWKEDSRELYPNFLYLVSLAKEIIKREIVCVGDEQIASKIVLDIYNKAENKKLLVLDTYYPLEAELANIPETLFVVYPDRAGNSWHLETVSDGTGSYNSKKILPKSWAGKRDQELENATGVMGATFCHNRLFLAVAKTKEAVLKLAEIALNS